MYDAKSEPNEFVGESREDVVAKAARFYGVEESELRVKEPEVGEIFGLGARTVIVAVPKNVTARPPRSDRDRGGDRDRPRGRDRERGGRERGGRGGRGSRNGGSDRDSGRRPERPRASSRAEELPAEPAAAPEGPSKGTAAGDLSELGEYMLGMVERMAIGSFELREVEDGEFVVLELKGDAADALSSGDSRAIGALQLLVNQAAMRADESPKRVVLDCGDTDEDQRESFLERQAGRAAKRALDTGRAVALDPMHARDRRALHVAVRDIDRVVTMSIGTGRYRQVVIVPEGADEYEEALAASKEAREREDGDS